MSQALRKLTGGVARSKCVLVFINQIREKIGVMFGSPETTPGGRALKFYSSCRLDVRRIGPVKEGEEIDRVAGEGEGGQEQSRAAVSRLRVRHDVTRASRARETCWIWRWRDKIVEKSGSWFNSATAAWPGPRKREAIPPGQPRGRDRP